MTEEEWRKLKKIVKRNKCISRIRLKNDETEKVTPIKINLDSLKKPVKVKMRKYPTEQQKFSHAYISELVKMSFLKDRPATSWQAAPHLVPTNAKTKCQAIIDLQSVNAATKSK